MTTNIRKNVSTLSHRNACPSEPLGSVAPTCATFPSEPRSTSAAASAPASCAGQYTATRRHGKCRVSANANVTAGLKWAPEMCPTA
jgi:hypothetical protein